VDVVESVLAARAGGPEEQRLLEAIEHLGQREFVATAAISGRVLDRRFRSMDSQFAARGPMARRLAELRKMADQLDPTKIKLGGKHKLDDDMRELDRYFGRFAKTQGRLESILAELGQAKFALDRDTISADLEELSLMNEMEALSEHAFLAERLEGALAARLDRLAAEDPERASRLRGRFLAALRARHREILTQLAIATQGSAALQLVHEGNDGVRLAIDTAISTTAAALRTAVMAAQAAASQRIALEHVEAAQRARGAMAIQADALETGVAMRQRQTEALRVAWSDMRAALDEVDARKAAALRSISSADRELTRPKP
jgi:uncharacterized protein YaaN involved in tellurite resistance